MARHFIKFLLSAVFVIHIGLLTSYGSFEIYCVFIKIATVAKVFNFKNCTTPNIVNGTTLIHRITSERKSFIGHFINISKVDIVFYSKSRSKIDSQIAIKIPLPLSNGIKTAEAF